jgi:hypothetical protein
MAHLRAGTSSGFHNPSVHVGTPSSDTQDDWVNTAVYFHGFADLTSATERVQSPNFFCLGYEWYLFMYPRGYNLGDNAKEISVYLVLCSAASIKIEYQMLMNGFLGNHQKTTYYSSRQRMLMALDVSSSNAKRPWPFLRRGHW